MTAIATFAPYEPPTVKAIYEQFYLEERFEFTLPGIDTKGEFTFSEWLAYKDGKFAISVGYLWDGNSFKFKIGPLVFGVSDGPLIPGTNTPMGKIPSLGHDVIYQHIWAIAKALGLSVWKVRAAADRWFYERWLVEGQREQEARLYYNAVRRLGWIVVLSHWRENR